MFGKIVKLALVGLALLSTVVTPIIVQAESVTPSTMIDEINGKALWKAEESFFSKMDIKDVKALMGTKMQRHFMLPKNGIECDLCEYAVSWVEKEIGSNATETKITQVLEQVCNILPTKYHQNCQSIIAEYSSELIGLLLQKASPNVICSAIGICSADEGSDFPANFDGRQTFGKCIHPVRNQAQCGSCWAFSASEVLSDRFCISTKGTTDVILSPQTMVSCDSANMGCQGGYLDKAWKFMMSTGLASDVCEPYTSGGGDSGTCPAKCADGSAIKYYKAANYKHLTTEEEIQTELMTNGPVQVAFEVYQDFIAYKSGVYHHVSGSLLGGHAVELVGWGIDATTNAPYWLCKNSWDVTWGDHGYFKILRGKNECGIESNVYTGAPLTNTDGFVLDVKCDLCMFVTKFVEHELTTEPVEEAVEDLLDKACDILPKMTRGTCQHFVQAEWPKLVNLLVAKFPPEKVCSLIKAC